MFRVTDADLRRRPIEERFWEKVEKSDGCWRWVATTNQNGYGRFWGERRLEGAHRVSWELAHGAIPAGMQVLHRCDNPSCVRPEHLFLGAHIDNMRDSVMKGRHWHWRAGAPNPNTKLSPEERMEIGRRYVAVNPQRRSEKGNLQRALAEEYGVTAVRIGQIGRARVRDEMPHGTG